MFNELLDEILVLLLIFSLLSQVILGFFLNSFYHVEPDPHFLHLTLIDLSAFEDFLGDFELALDLFDVLRILFIPLFFDLVEFEFLLSVCLIIDFFEFSSPIFFDDV